MAPPKEVKNEKTNSSTPRHSPPTSPFPTSQNKSSLSMTSSLQRALAAASKPKSQIETSNGAFESCFAGGLDLSEFAKPQQRLGMPKSAAAELLRVRAEERKQMEQNEAEEQKLEEIIKMRVSNLSSLSKEPRNSNAVVDALVKMHGHDTSRPTFRTKKSKPRKSGSSRGSQPSKFSAAKKSRRIKY